MTNWLRRGLLILLTLAAAYPLLSAWSNGNALRRDLAGEAPVTAVPEKCVIEARCRNFLWEFSWQSPFPNRRMPFELQLPADCEVELVLASDDYIYSFDLPKHGIRQVVIPGQTYRHTLVTGTPETIDLIADPLCGFRLFHDEVMGRITIVPRNDFALVANAGKMDAK